MLEKRIDRRQVNTHFPGTEQMLYFEALDLLVNGIKTRL